MILFFYQYILGVSESGSLDVLQASRVAKIDGKNTSGDVKTIMKYSIEHVDTDGKRKSIRPKDCYAFDDVEYGVTSFMKRICRRNFFAIEGFKPNNVSVTNLFGATWKPNFIPPNSFLDPSNPTSRIVPPSLDLSISGVGTNTNSTSSYSSDSTSPFRFEWVNGVFGQLVQYRIANVNGVSKDLHRLTFAQENGGEQWFSNLITYPLNKLTGSGNNVFVYYGGNGLVNQSLKDTYIFREEKPDVGRNSVLTSAHLTEVSGVPVMIYYGGIYGIDRNANSVYLITRLWNSESYYTKACGNYDTPKVVYRVQRGNETILYYRNSVTNISDNANKCFTGGMADGTSLKDYCRDEGLRLTTPEIFRRSQSLCVPNDSTKGSACAWDPAMECKTFGGFRADYQKPDLSEVRLTIQNGRIILTGKRSIVAVNDTNGFALGERISCLGISDNDKCVDIIEYVGRSDSYLAARSVTTGTNRYSSTVNIDTNVRANVCNNFSTCNTMPLIKDTSLRYSNESGGYELPTRWYSWDIRAVEFLRSGGPFFYTDPYQRSGQTKINLRSGSIPSNLNYTFADENFLYGILLKNNHFVLYQFDITKVTPNNGPVRYDLYVNSQPSPTFLDASLLKKENITTTFTTTTTQVNRITILFSDKISQSSSKYEMFGTTAFATTDCIPDSISGLAPCGSLYKIENIYLKEDPNQPILALKVYPQDLKYESDLNLYDYVYVTRDYVKYAKVSNFGGGLMPPCSVSVNASAIITNTSPNSNLTSTWPLSYSETQLGRLVMSLRNSNNTPITCNGQGISSAQVTVATVNSPSNSFTVIGNVAVNPTNNTLTFQAPLNLRPLPSNMYYNITSLRLTFGTGNTPVVLTPTTHPNLFGTRGWDFYTENIVRITIQNSPASFPLTVSVDKYRTNQLAAISKFPNLKVNSPFDILSNTITNFYFDSEYPASANSLNNYYYDLCFALGINVSSFSANNPNLELTANGPSCVRFRHRSNSQGASPINVTINLASSVGGSIGCDINGNLYTDNASGVKMFPKSANLKAQEGILFSNTTNSNSAPRYLTNSQFFPGFFQSSQTTLQGFIASSSLNLAASGSEFYLLTNPNSPVEGSGSAFPVSNYVTLSNPNSSTKDFHILAVSKGRGLRIDLTNSFLQTQKIDNFAFVNMTGKLGERVRFFADCSDPNYSFICGNQFKYIVKAPIYGSVLFEFRNAPTSSACRNIVFTENPDILMNLIPTIRNKKLNVVTSTPINITYLD